MSSSTLASATKRDMGVSAEGDSRTRGSNDIEADGEAVSDEEDEGEQNATLAESLTLYPSWHNFAAGGVAGAGSRVVTAPLDLIRIRRQLTPASLYPSESLWQSWTKIVQTEGGTTALFRGNVAALYLWVGYSAVQFSLYNQTRDVLLSHEGVSTSAAAFGAGALAGTCATLATYPFDVCRTTFAARGIVETNLQPVPSPVQHNDVTRGSSGHRRPVPFSSLVEPSYTHPNPLAAAPPSPPPLVANQPPKTLAEFALQLYQLKGIRGFYAGAYPAVLQIIPYMGLNFMIYDALVAGDKRVQNSGYAGALSGATSKILVYPIDTVKRRLQAQAFYDATPAEPWMPSGYNNKRQYANMVDCAVRILREEGVLSFYRGVVPSVLKTTIASSLSFGLFRFAKNSLEYAHDSMV